MRLSRIYYAWYYILTMDPIRLALAQINPIAGDLKGNSDLIITYAERASAQGADLVVFPELALSGYHPRDLIASKGFLTSCLAYLKKIYESVPGIPMLVGLPLMESSVTNSAALCFGGAQAGSFGKSHMPGRGFQEESKYFDPAGELQLMRTGGALIGVNIREDLWYIGGPAEQQCRAGASLIINMSAWPFVSGRTGFAERLVMSFAARFATPVAFVNMAGASDELVFEGGSLVMGADGLLIARARPFVEDLLIVDVPLREKPESINAELAESADSAESAGVSKETRLIELPAFTQERQKAALAVRESPEEPLSPEQALYSALATAIVDFTEKGNYKGAMLVLGGGIAPALNAAITVDALGSASVSALVPPGKGEDTARRCAELLGVKCIETPEDMKSPRAMGYALMEAADAEGMVALSSITKSDLATGGVTLYGESAGHFAPLKDLWGTDVLLLSNWRNSMGEAVPASLIAPAQKNSPEDEALKILIEEDMGFDEAMQAAGIGPAGLEELFKRIQAAEQLRRQAPPGPRVTPKALGPEWALPLAGRFRPGN